VVSSVAYPSALGVPCFLENDVRTAALGVQRYDAGAAIQHLAYVSIGTGIAAGLILQGRLYTGAHGMAGEIGHMIVEPNGRRCACGARGCLETVAAGPAIARLGQEAVATTRENMTLQVGLVALQGMFASDTRGMAAGVVMTVIPIMIFFVALQRQFVRGLTGAVKG